MDIDAPVQHAHGAAVATLNDGSARPPALRVYMNMGNVDTLPPESTGPKGSVDDKLRAIRVAGYDGVQGADPALCSLHGLGAAASARFNHAEEVAPAVSALKAAGYACVTVHVGWGMESDAQIDRLVAEIIAVSVGEQFPVYIETHRATITQDLWRTVRMVERHPGVRFNADFSHWYTGLELPYGNIDDKFDFMAPVLERVRFFHGRMGNSGQIQVALNDPSMAKASAHFRELWIRAIAAFLRGARQGDYLVFAPELLAPSINYARTFVNHVGARVEESDRWVEAQLYAQFIRDCFVRAACRCDGRNPAPAAEGVATS